jgi:DNA (cytosine-5)-methyltransferase 1
MQTLRFAQEFRPRWIVLENVVHMRPWSRYEELKAELRALGYSVSETTIDASHFGVPQSRRRLFLICDREREPRTPLPLSSKIKSVDGILDASGVWNTSPLFHPRRAAGTLQRAQRAFDALGTETSFLIVYYGSDGSGGWQPLSRPLRTITTVDRFALVEPAADGPQMRMLQVPELMRAMGLNRTYRLEFGSRRDKIQLLGNGVCPPVMREVIRALAS